MASDDLADRPQHPPPDACHHAPVYEAAMLLGRGVQTARALGLLQDAVASQLAIVVGEVRSLASAPLSEGLARLSQAVETESQSRRQLLLEEARGKFTDVASRDLSPSISTRAHLCLAVTWAQLGEASLAQSSCASALEALHGCFFNSPPTWSDSVNQFGLLKALKWSAQGASSAVTGDLDEPEPDLDDLPIVHAAYALAEEARQIANGLGMPAATFEWIGSLPPVSAFERGTPLYIRF